MTAHLISSRFISAFRRSTFGVTALPVSTTRSFVMLAIALAAAPSASARERTVSPWTSPTRPTPFNFDTLLAEAKRRAATPYAPQRSTFPAGLDKLSPEQYRSIHFNPDAGIWRKETIAVSARAAACRLQSAVGRGDGVDRRRRYGPQCRRHPGDVRYGARPCRNSATSRCRCRAFAYAAKSTRKKSGTNSWCSRAQATFVRLLSISCTVFRPADWQSIPPSPRAKNFRRSRIFGSSALPRTPASIVIYALLESRSTTGAYRFTVQPGVETTMDVETDAVPARRHARGRHRAAHLHVLVRRNQSRPPR